MSMCKIDVIPSISISILSNRLDLCAAVLSEHSNESLSY